MSNLGNLPTCLLRYFKLHHLQCEVGKCPRIIGHGKRATAPSIPPMAVRRGDDWNLPANGGRQFRGTASRKAKNRVYETVPLACFPPKIVVWERPQIIDDRKI